ncbi:MAG: hypothetical protein ACXWKQ_04670 [Reyranella sp.]
MGGSVTATKVTEMPNAIGGRGVRHSTFRLNSAKFVVVSINALFVDLCGYICTPLVAVILSKPAFLLGQMLGQREQNQWRERSIG